ncbi:hypothetical protein O181_071549, partial [Austropuccinia psidii MF-1]|nr:hypothetical protein [Austropuccinia psidii MF-1]
KTSNRRNDLLKSKKRIDYARGQVLLESSDEEDLSDKQNFQMENDNDQDDNDDDFDETSSISEDEEQEIELGPTHSKTNSKKIDPINNNDSEFEIDLNENFEEQVIDDDEATSQVKPTNRIAVVNLDWDNLKPIDLFKVFSSLLSPTAPPINTTQDQNHLSNKKPKHHIARGRVNKVSFYKSQFGKERMLLEDVHGPPREIFKKPNVLNQDLATSDKDDSDSEDLIQENDGNEFDEEALRRYQLDRLRYFYAIVELDSVDAAKHVYNEIEGTEFERTANIFDLRYVPEEMTFEENDLHDECTEDVSNYKGVDFSTDALRHSKVKLTWDAEDPHRSKVTRLNTQKLKHEEIDEIDFQDFVAPPSSDEEAQNESSSNNFDRQKLRSLLGLADKQDSSKIATENDEKSDVDLDITFTPAFVENNSKKSIDYNASKYKLKTDYESNQSKLDSKNKKSKLAKNIIKANTKVEEDVEENNDKVERPSTQAELELLLDDDHPHDLNNHHHSHFDLNHLIKLEKLESSKLKKSIKKKLEKKLLKNSSSLLSDQSKINNQDQFEIDTDDSRFSKVFNDFEFAIDPSNPQFKKTKNMNKLVESTRKRRSDQDGNSNFIPKEDNQTNTSSEVNQLINTLKSKKKRLN